MTGRTPGRAVSLHLAAAGQLVAKGEQIVEALGGERMEACPIEHAVTGPR